MAQRFTVLELDGGSFEVVVGTGMSAKARMECPKDSDPYYIFIYTLWLAAVQQKHTTASFEEWLPQFDTIGGEEPGE